MRFFLLLVLFCSSSVWAWQTQTLLEPGQGRWGFSATPELRINNQGVGYRLKLSSLYTSGDHGLELGVAGQVFDTEYMGDNQNIAFYGLVLGYRFLPFEIGYLDSNLTMGAAVIDQTTAYAAELSAAWKINVSSWLQVGAGLAVLQSAPPNNADMESLQDVQMRMLLELGKF